MRPFSRQRLAVLFFAALLPAAAIAEKTVAGFKFPDTLAGLAFDSTHDYAKDGPGLGVSLGYVSRDGIWADVYIYDLQQRVIPDGVTNLTRLAFEDAVNTITGSKQYGIVKVIAPAEQSEVRGVPWLHAVFSYTMVGTKITYSSHLFVTAKHGQFVKVRLSGPAAQSTNVGLTARTFVNQLSRLLTAP